MQHFNTVEKAVTFNTEFKGRWRIVVVDTYDQAFVNCEEVSYIEFDPDGLGAFHFGHIFANIDYFVDEQGMVKFSFYGEDNWQKISGLGSAKIDNEKLFGSLHFYKGKESKFQAIKEASSKQPQYIPFSKRKKRNPLINKLNLSI